MKIILKNGDKNSSDTALLFASSTDGISLEFIVMGNDYPLRKWGGY